MVRRYLQRKNIKPDSSEENKFTNKASSNLEIKDMANVDERQILLDDKMRPKTPFEKVQVETRNAMDKAGNVGQYVKYVNHHIERKNSEIQKIKEKKNNFDKEVSLLKLDSEGVSTQSYSLPQLNKEDLAELKKSLVIEQTKQKIYLNKLKEQVWDAEESIQNLEKEIKQLERHITISPEKEDATAQIIKERMNALSKKYDAKTISDILDALESSL